jgi:hypothetical protein
MGVPNMFDAATIRWVIGGFITAFITMLVATWRTAQRSKDAEDALRDVAALKKENHELRVFLFGDELTGRKGIVRDIQESKEFATRAVSQTGLVYRAFRVPSGSSDTEVIAHIRDAVNNSNVTHTGEWPAVQPPHDPRPAGTLPKRTLRPFNKPIPRDE